jgi:hypothetical protein
MTPFIILSIIVSFIFPPLALPLGAGLIIWYFIFVIFAKGESKKLEEKS